MNPERERKNSLIRSDREDKRKKLKAVVEKRLKGRRKHFLQYKTELVAEFGIDVYNRFVEGKRLSPHVEHKIIFKLRELGQ